MVIASVPHTMTFSGTGTCKKCGYISSNELCKACVLLEGLARDAAERTGIVAV
jgi:hypothetical protein